MSSSLETDPILRDVPSISGYKVLSPCVLWGRIGAGGMGAVYLARHLNLEIDVAVKCLTGHDAPLVARFLREARVAARINHPNLVRVYDVLEEHGVHYIVMEYVRGETLVGRVSRRGPLLRDEAVEVMAGAARGVAELHRLGIVHRDLKPANVLLSSAGVVKVADLGLVRERGGDAEAITRSGEAFGTLHYMPPEQFEGASEVGPAADIWSLGATLFHALAGESAYSRGLSRMAIVGQILSQPFPDIAERRGDLDEEFVVVLRRCVAKAPEERFGNADELLAALEPLRAESAADLSDETMAQAPAGHEDAEPPSHATSRDIQERLKSGPISVASDAESFETGVYDPIDPSASVPVVAPFVDEAPAAPRRRRGRGLLVLAVVLLALVVGAGLAHREGWFEGTRGEGPETDRADSAEVPDEIEPTDVEPEPPPLRGTTEAARPAEPPPPTFDRGALIEAVRKVATEVHRARGSRKDIEDGRQDIRIFRATGGLDDAIEKAEDAIDRARRLIEQYHARAVEEAVLVLGASARFPEESGRVLEEEMKSARDAWKEHRIDTITALRRIVAERPDSADAYEGAARRGLAHLFAK